MQNEIMYRLTRPIQLVQFHVYYVSSDIFLHMQHSYEHEPLDSGAYIHTVECTPRTETGLCSVSDCPNSTDTHVHIRYKTANHHVHMIQQVWREALVPLEIVLVGDTGIKCISRS